METDPTNLVLGSNQWVEAVYASGPARAVAGKSRSTQRHTQVSDDGQQDFVLEGRGEHTAGILLNVLRNAGKVRRYKGQPFELKSEIHGVSAFPDFMLDLTDGRRFVAEVKTVRWLDQEEMAQQLAVRDALADTSTEYLLWTDKWPLNRGVFHNMNHLRRANSLGFEIHELDKVAMALEKSPRTFGELTDKPFNLSFDLVLASIYKGKAHCNFLQPITGQSYVYLQRNDRIIESLFETRLRNGVGWNSMPGCPVGR